MLVPQLERRGAEARERLTHVPQADEAVRSHRVGHQADVDDAGRTAAETGEGNVWMSEDPSEGWRRKSFDVLKSSIAQAEEGTSAAKVAVNTEPSARSPSPQRFFTLTR